MKRWKLHPTWTVDGEPREFAPSFTRTRIGARRLERQFRRRFAHFEDFDVAVRKVSRDEADAGRPVLPSLDSPDWPKTTHCAADDTHTLCNLVLTEVSGYCSPDWFVSRRRKKGEFWVDCDECTAAVRSRG